MNSSRLFLVKANLLCPNGSNNKFCSLKGGQTSQHGLPSTSLSIKLSFASVRGRRNHMEDEFYCSENGHFVGVFDGHGGSRVARFLRRSLYSYFLQRLCEERPWSNEEVTHALNDALERVDSDVSRNGRWCHQGSTAAIAFINIREGKATLGSPISYSIITANIGDSRVILARNGCAMDLTSDHKPENPSEKHRIESLGGHVVWHGLERQGRPIEGTGVYRVNGNLSLSRAIGDRAERPYVSSSPDTRIIEGDHEADQFVLSASDGFFDVFTSQDAVDYVLDTLKNIEEKYLYSKRRLRSREIEEIKRIIEKRQSSDRSVDVDGGDDDVGGELDVRDKSEEGSIHDKRSVYRYLAEMNECRRKMAKRLVAEALRRGSTDNITVLIQWFEKH